MGILNKTNMTLSQFTNLNVADKMATLNSLYKGLVKFTIESKAYNGEYNSDLESLKRTMGMS